MVSIYQDFSDTNLRDQYVLEHFQPRSLFITMLDPH
jgi:hypothetical protein